MVLIKNCLATVFCCRGSSLLSCSVLSARNTSVHYSSSTPPSKVAFTMEEMELVQPQTGADSGSWIKENIRKRECCFYEKEDECKCGNPKSDHVYEAIKPDNFTGESWNKDRHVREFPTDAFGEIRFGGSGQKTGKYARVSTDTSPEILYKLLTEQWKLSPPNLLISVTGGAKNFYLKPRLKSMFHRGLIKVAQTTGAWIITGGTQAGVMKRVGRAVRDHALSSSMQGQIVAIGIATWGIIHNRDALVNRKDCFPANYEMDIRGQEGLSSLNKNHTHFLMVDDGTQGNYGVEIELRSSLEKYISERNSGVTIPVVCVVLDGGPGTLNTIHNAMLNETQCVILEGSGRISDVIAQVAGLPLFQVTIALIDQLMKKFFGQEYKSFSHFKIIEWTKKIQDIIRKSHLLTVFRISEDNHRDVDVAILQALLKASRASERLGIKSLKGQLELAIAWNRVDLAETEIFTEESQWKSSELHWAMRLALEKNRPQFVSLLLENGVTLKDFLDKKTLGELYQKISMSVSNVVFQLLSSFTDALHQPPSSPVKMQKHEETLALVSSMGSQTQLRENNMDAQGNPGRDLFLWAVVQSNKELAEIAWEQCKDCMSAALAASKILKTMAEEESDADEAEDMRELASHFEDHAIGVFSECHDNDEERARKLLVRVSPSWGRTTCLRLALEADDKTFVAQSGVQALLTQIWCGGLSVDNPVWRVLICMVFFPLIYTGFLRQKPLSCRSRLVHLYSSPQVKFYWNAVSHFAFLFLYAVVVMIDFQATPSAGEMLLYVWLLSLVCEEVRQVLYDPDGFGFHKKAKMYINDLWNILDVLSIILFAIGLTFRLTTELFYVGKILLCIDFVVFCLRFMAIFTISSTLGPKIITVRRMVRDMFFFMFLLSIWVVAYGVAKQGILIHNDNRLDWIVHGAIYEPYRIIFGDFPKNIDYAAFDLDSCSMNGTDPLKPKCPVLNENLTPAFPEWLTIIMLCVYLLFANILLLNLLIAIFNFTFQTVQDNTDRIWKFQRYELIQEYHSRPAAPPPFIIFSHFYLLVRNMFPVKASIISEEFSNEEQQLLSWEALMKDRYLLSTKRKKNQSMERRILDTFQKSHLLLFSLSLSSLPAAWSAADESTETETEKEDGHHVKARQLHYPNSKLTRFPVPEEKVPWEVFNFHHKTTTSCWLPTSQPHCKTLFIGFRLNPRGRTGIRGRGTLSRLGPNRSTELVCEGYVDDCRNTDNAWVEITVLNIHLESTSHNGALQWQEVSVKTRLHSHQREFLRLVAKLHNRRF
uniref:Transient receptor potential cation channel, subfamily M, member 2 n=1 Tax=Gasterosteus aculeatus aculeatus TaxID=481459 RepID=A0AAQ4QDD8_GASAC